MNTPVEGSNIPAGLNNENQDVHTENTYRKQRNFIKPLLIIFCILTACTCLGITLLRNWIKPAVIPQINIIDDSNTDDNFARDMQNADELSKTVGAKKEESAFLKPEGNKEDESVGGGLQAPEGFTSDDRKELFYTFLIIGLDEGNNTDTIITASYDGVNHEANIISIPRDTLVDVKREIKKINAAYPVGALNGGGKDGGIAQLQRELKTVIGFVPDFYILVNFKSVIEMVDAVGGIEVNVPFTMNYDDPEQDLHIHISKGLQNLNGKDALTFARYRKGNGGHNIISDYDRIEHQQTVIKAMLDKLLRPRNILKISKFIDIFNENVYSNINSGNMLWFAGELNKISGTDALSVYTMPTNGASGEPMYYEYLDKNGVIDLVNNTINPFIKDIQSKDIDIIRFN